MKVHELVSDELWAIIEPPHPPHPPQPKGGNRWLPDRPAWCGIIDVLKTGMRWNDPPLELGCGSGSTCWRRLRAWQRAGVWHALHRALLDQLGAAGGIDWSRASLASASVRAKGGPGDGHEPDGSRQTGHGAPPCGRPPGHPARGGPDRRGSPGRGRLRGAAGGGRADQAPAGPPAPPSGQAARRPGRRRAALPALPAPARDRGRIARKGVEGTTKLGRHRRVVERTLAWLGHFRRLAIRYERREAVHQALLDLGCALICLTYWQREQAPVQ